MYIFFGWGKCLMLVVADWQQPEHHPLPIVLPILAWASPLDGLYKCQVEHFTAQASEKHWVAGLHWQRPWIAANGSFAWKGN